MQITMSERQFNSHHRHRTVVCNHYVLHERVYVDIQRQSKVDQYQDLDAMYIKRCVRVSK